MLALALTPGVGGKTIARVLTRNDLLGRTEEEFLRLPAEVLREEYGLKAKAASSWCEGREVHIQDAILIQQRFEALDLRWLTQADAHYPRRVEAMDADPPGVLFLHGSMKLLGARTFAVLASRKAPREVLTQIEHMTEQAVLDGEVLVSGHDTPEYQASAIVPLRWGAPRILVLDKGLLEALGEDLTEEPFPAARLWRYRFDPHTDLAISAVHPMRGYHPSANRARDRLVTAMADRLDLPWVSQGGNMDKLARAALKLGRPVRVGQGTARDELIRLGARLLETR